MKATSTQDTSPPQSIVAETIKACRHALLAVALFTGIINVLMLTGSFFMLQVYDRVIPSRSIPTLLGLVALVVLLYAFQGILDAVRGRILVRIGASLDERLRRQAYEAVVRLPLVAGPKPDGLQPLRDLDQIRTFLSGLGPTALFDLPWMPLYLGLCFAFHVWIGVTALIGAILLIAMTVMTERLTRSAIKESAASASARLGQLEAGRRNAEVVRSMGMTERLFLRWSVANVQYIETQQQVSDVVGGFGSLSRVLRMLLQSAVLAVGAILVINQQATAGVMIASSILTSRALAPVELAIAHWKSFASTRQSWRRLSELINHLAAPAVSMVLPAPTKEISIEGVAVVPPGSQRLVVQNVSFRLRAGDGLGIIGPSASGKSSLVRALVGVWPAIRGKVRLDDAALEQWGADQLGSHIGYLPQDVELFDGSIADNISRFDPKATSEDIIEAARVAGVHELVLRLPEGYETKIGDGGAALSAGQRQRVGLARALYKDPFLVVLDEPNSNLDTEGDQALAQAIVATRRRGAIVIVVAHRQSTLAGLDLLLVLANGQLQSFGPKDDVLQQTTEMRRQPAQKAPVLVEAGRAS